MPGKEKKRESLPELAQDVERLICLAYLSATASSMLSVVDCTIARSRSWSFKAFLKAL
jgi:hypothetical protein